MVLSENFKLARTAKNLTQTELAKLIGCTKQTISDIERGYRPPSAKIVKAMAECTGCSADEILGVEKKGEDENEEDKVEEDLGDDESFDDEDDSEEPDHDPKYDEDIDYDQYDEYYKD